MPEDFYKVGPSDNRHFDELDLHALERDWATWSEEPSGDVMQRSQFNLLYDIGVHFFGRKSKQALEYAMYFMETRERVVPIVRPPDPQSYLGLACDRMGR
jgi:hypothetical protein